MTFSHCFTLLKHHSYITCHLCTSDVLSALPITEVYIICHLVHFPYHCVLSTGYGPTRSHGWVFNAATAHGLHHYLTGTALNLLLSKKDGKFYLSDKALNKLETSIDSWEQMEAQVHELIYNTVDNATFLQIKGEKTAAALWTKQSKCKA